MKDRSEKAACAEIIGLNRDSTPFTKEVGQRPVWAGEVGQALLALGAVPAAEETVARPRLSEPPPEAVVEPRRSES